MSRFLKMAHILGLVLFLGSIFTFIVASGVIRGADVLSISVGRRIISSGTDLLTVPALLLVVISGAWMAWVGGGFASRFVRIKLAIGVLLLLNAVVFVVPAVHLATELAVQSVSSGQLLPGFSAAYMQEEIAGALNILLGIGALAVGVWKTSLRG